MKEDQERGLMKRILVPTDFSEASLRAVQYAVELTSAVRGRMLLLHVVEGDPVRLYTTGGFPERLAYLGDLKLDRLCYAVPQMIFRRDLDEEARWKLAALLPPGAPSRFRALVPVGRVAADIIRVAGEEKADLIVLGTDGRRGLRHLLRSSIADKVIRKTPTRSSSSNPSIHVSDRLLACAAFCTSALTGGGSSSTPMTWWRSWRLKA
jgi:nucleotide-binding universal stress UspA family protein